MLISSTFVKSSIFFNSQYRDRNRLIRLRELPHGVLTFPQGAVLRHPDRARRGTSFSMTEVASSATVKDYLTPAPNDDAIRKALLVGRHLIILNKSISNRAGS
jgi:hypothetical protein